MNFIQYFRGNKTIDLDIFYFICCLIMFTIAKDFRLCNFKELDAVKHLRIEMFQKYLLKVYKGGDCYAFDD